MLSHKYHTTPDIKIFWHPQGDYLAVKVDRFTKTRKSTYTGFELFSIREKAIPMDVSDAWVSWGVASCMLVSVAFFSCVHLCLYWKQLSLCAACVNKAEKKVLSLPWEPKPRATAPAIQHTHTHTRTTN